MNKFQSFFGRFSAETCLKIDYFGSVSQNRQTLGAPPPDHRLDSMNRKCTKILLL